MTTWAVLLGDVRDRLRDLAPGSVQTCVTSPPYWGLRDYGTAAWSGGDPACDHRHALGGEGAASAKQNTSVGTQSILYRETCGKCGAVRVDAQIGLEATPAEYVAGLVAVFAEVWRVLADDGTLWLNLGDCYATGGGRVGECPGGGAQGERWAGRGLHTVDNSGKAAARIAAVGPMTQPNRMPLPGLKPKDLVGIPWRVAFALQAAGWYLRSDVIWSKPNPMPESVTDRPTKAHEYIFLLTKAARYYYDADAIAEDGSGLQGGRQRAAYARTFQYAGAAYKTVAVGNGHDGIYKSAYSETRNRRSVWTVATQPYAGAHFATFPEALIEPCVLAGSRVGDTVLDPFCGSGTTGAVAVRLQRSFVGVELNPAYVALARTRIGSVAPLFAGEVVAPAPVARAVDAAVDRPLLAGVAEVD